ncbi:uroporphyrinogen-III synthase [Pararhizobium sp. BT-229]|uniref:uroporphyrinogen-III synthase n=1 Tax=Pararhizobium sp. BT-229 TaxID=2986923 RepID=UPI0021F78093|nr:uroporphyrinogen-III synthase [Pararhizobium sp. BT-229]MCV9966089.1 uroporphyrinogen-III synthase [Pararhizobium sp. BT-229]
MRVLVTRPQPSAAATAARLEAMGHEAIVLPMMEAVHDSQAALDVLSLPHSAIAITSAETIRALAPIKDNLLPHLATPIFCVGPATAEAARQFGFQSVGTSFATGRALAGLVAETFSHEFHGIPKIGLGNLIYLAGVPRSPDFEAGLQDFGIPCRVAQVYRMSPILYTPKTVDTLLQANKPDVALFYSHETARHFFASIPPETSDALRGVRLLCLSEHVAAAIPAGFARIAVAAEPSEASLFALL